MSAGPLVKVCGFTRAVDIEVAIDLGASAFGFVFHSKSKRFVNAEHVRRIMPRRMLGQIVGVFVNDPVSKIAEICSLAGLTTIQLHGDETPKFCERLKNALPQTLLIKAIRVRGLEDIDSAATFNACDAILFDSYTDDQYGGTGQCFEWSSLEFRKPTQTVYLSGGLNSRNVGRAVQQIRPDYVDVSSGVESSPGIKDFQKMRAFFAAVQESKAC